MTELLIPVSIGLRGRFKFVCRDADLNVKWETDWSKNMVLNRGLDHLGGTDVGAWGLNGCQVGSGSLAPAAGQTSLQTYVAGTVTVQASSATSDAGASPPYTRITTTWRFGVGVAAGNLTEVGIGIGTNTPLSNPGSAGRSDQPLFSRALIVDGGGSPITLTILLDEVLDVVWEYTKFAPAADIVGNFTIVEDGVPVNRTYTVRAASSDVSQDRWSVNKTSLVQAVQGSTLGNCSSAAFDVALQPVFDNVSGTGSLSSTHVSDVYVNGTFFRDSTQTFGLTQGNLTGGIDLLYINLDIVGWQMAVSPPIPKLSTMTLSITYRTSWANVP